MQDAITQLFLEAMQAAFPPVGLSVSEWADQNRVLSAENCAEPGPWLAFAPLKKDAQDLLIAQALLRLLDQVEDAPDTKSGRETFAPLESMRSATASPMPCAPPVTIATRSLRS